jgi:hypothetical protein
MNIENPCQDFYIRFMTIEEQEHIKQDGYAEAMRYIANAKDYLQKAGMDGDGRYRDKKYVRTACGAAYNGVLEALGTYFQLKNPDALKTKESKTIDFYRKNLAKENAKVLKTLNSVYTILHIEGYYEGILEMLVIKAGFQRAKQIIDLIKPAGAA